MIQCGIIYSKDVSKKVIRPLSANRVSTDKNRDSNEEASAVLAALKAENEQASKHNSVPRKMPSNPTGKQVSCSLYHVGFAD